MMSTLMMLTMNEAITMMGFVYATIITVMFVHDFNKNEDRA